MGKKEMVQQAGHHMSAMKEKQVETGHQSEMPRELLCQPVYVMTWTIKRAYYPKASGTYTLSQHAQQRMRERRIDRDAVRRALILGRVIYTQGAAHFVLGRKEVKRYASVPPSDNGIQVVVTGIQNGTVLTTYRNPDEMPRA